MIYRIVFAVVLVVLMMLYLVDFSKSKFLERRFFNSVYMVVSAICVSLIAYYYQVPGVFHAFLYAAVVTLLLNYQDVSSQSLEMKILYPTIVIGCLVAYNNPMTSLVSSLIGALGIGGAMLLVARLSHESIGYGDGVLLLLLGLVLGWQMALTVLLIAFVISSFYGLILLTFRKKSRKDRIAFVPFIAVSLLFIQLI